MPVTGTKHLESSQVTNTSLHSVFMFRGGGKVSSFFSFGRPLAQTPDSTSYKGNVNRYRVLLLFLLNRTINQRER